MPHAGHFILGDSCRFHLNTYVNECIVSTIGELWLDSQVRKIHADVHGVIIQGIGDEWDFNYLKHFGYAELGLDRLYETMVFKAVKSESHYCCPYKPEVFSNIDMDGYNTAKEAYLGHLEMCEKWDKK